MRFSLLLVLCLAAKSSALTLYDGALGTSPASQGYLSHYSLPGFGSETVSPSHVVYDSSSNSLEHGGYSNYTLGLALINPAFPELDRAKGYSLSLRLRQLSESHSPNNRSGLSLIVLSSDHLGIELEFWPDQVWAQSGSDFSHAESAAFNPQAAEATYTLMLSGSDYSLSADGLPLLSGPLRDYSAANAPYNLPSYFFLGDNTSSASGAFQISSLSLAVPEPALGFFLILPAVGWTRRARR